MNMQQRLALYSGNRLKLGLFGANCSSGRAVTKVPERWSGSWPDCLRLARMAVEWGMPVPPDMETNNPVTHVLAGLIDVPPPGAG